MWQVVIGMTKYRCKYCGEVDDERSVYDHMKCAARFMFEEVEDNG